MADGKKKGYSEYDVLVVGSGIAGLYAALKAADFARVCLLTKEKINNSNTWLAQGGIAAAIGEDDSPRQHLEDTLAAGAGLCCVEVVSLMVEEGLDRVRELLSLGTPFDRDLNRLALTKEGAHHKNRVLHAGGDATGRLIQETLQEKLLQNNNVDVQENTFVTELMTYEGAVRGVRTLQGDVYAASAVILATGGIGQLYSSTTNSAVATGDGIAMAYRAGAVVADLEFIQFHPTVFPAKRDQKAFLISEALRGEGAFLRNIRGERFMDEYHEMAELGPRDVVARAIVDQMQRHDSPHVYLDITRRGKSFLATRFPTIYSMAGKHNLDLSQDWLPVAPAAHYAMGGIHTGRSGETSMSGLFACGEVACSGVHGANRLASNSLLDGLVFAARAVKEIRKAGKAYSGRVKYDHTSKSPMQSVKTESIRKQLQGVMFKHAGIIRDRDGLVKLGNIIKTYTPLFAEMPKSPAEWELQNLMTVASLIQRFALTRTESRGAHFRSDFPAQDSAWARHLSCSKKQKEDLIHAPVAV